MHHTLHLTELRLSTSINKAGTEHECYNEMGLYPPTDSSSVLEGNVLTSSKIGIFFHASNFIDKKLSWRDVLPYMGEYLHSHVLQLCSVLQRLNKRCLSVDKVLKRKLKQTHKVKYHNC